MGRLWFGVSKSPQRIRNVKSATGEVLMKDDEIKERWGHYFNMLMNKENQRVEQKKETPTKQWYGTSVRKKQRQPSKG